MYMTEETEHQKESHSETFNHYEYKTLLSWQAPERPFKKRTKNFYVSGLLIALFIEIILFLFSQQMLMLVVLSLVFVGFALASVPPRNIQYKITTEGVTIEDHFYGWQELYDFYFKVYASNESVHIRTHYFVPGEVILLLGDITLEHIRSILIQYLPYREIVRPTLIEKSGEWLSRNFPLEQPSTVKKS